MCSDSRCPNLLLRCSGSFIPGFKENVRQNNICKWYTEFVGTGFLCKAKNPIRSRVSDDNVKWYRVREVFQ